MKRLEQGPRLKISVCHRCSLLMCWEEGARLIVILAPGGAQEVGPYSPGLWSALCPLDAPAVAV